LQRAEQKGAPRIYRDLKDKVSEAGAAARSNAEVRVFRDRPYEWLRVGPGRSQEGEPGWTDVPTKLQIEADISARQEVTIEQIIPDETILGTLQVLQQCGIILPGAGQDFLQQQVIDVETETSGNGNGELHDDAHGG
jgi:hypothetical protein